MKYFFALENHKHIQDSEPHEFPNDRAAMREAQGISNDLSQGRDRGNDYKIVVTNEHGDRVGQVATKWN